MMIWPLRVPAAAGLKYNVRLQNTPAASDDGQPLVIGKSAALVPATTTLEIASGPVPELFTQICRGVLHFATGSLPIYTLEYCVVIAAVLEVEVEVEKLLVTAVREAFCIQVVFA